MKRRTKKWAILSLCAAMSLSCGFAVAGVMPSIPTAVIAEEAQVDGVAKVGDTSYATFAQALTAASAMTGDVTVEIYEKVTLNTNLSGSYDSITFVGKSTDAEIYLEVQGYITATGKKVSFTDLTLSKSAGGFITNAGFMNVAFGVNDVKSVTYTNCIFANGAYASSGVVTFNGCTFNRSYDEYGLWAYGNTDATVNNCVFNLGGVKMYSEGSTNEEKAIIAIKESDFSTVVEKPAIVLTKGESIELAANEYPDLGVIRLDSDGNGTAIKSADPVTCVVKTTVDGQSVMVPAGAIVDGKIYTTVAQAANAATSGSIVTLLHDSTEAVTLPEGAMLNTNGYTAENVTADTELNAVAKIGYVYYETLQDALKAIKSGDTLTLMSDITISGRWNSRNQTNLPMTIDGNGKTLKFTGEINDGYNYLSAFTFGAAATVKNLTIDMSEAVSVFQSRFSAISALSDLTVDNCTFIGSTTYTSARAIIYGETPATTSSLNVSVSNCNFTNWKYGVTDEMNGKDTAKSVTVTDSTFTNASALLSASENVTFSKNDMDQGYVDVSSYTNTDGFTVTAMGNTLAENGAKPNVIKANPANITTDDASLAPVAKMGNTFYMSMDDLLAVMGNGDTYTLKGETNLYGGTLELPADVTFNGNGYSVNGSIAAGGNLTFAGYTKVTNFDAGYNKSVITIGEGATLELTGTGRMVIGHGNTFNIIGSLTDAKKTDITAVTPSLIANGVSFTGNSVNFNVTNAYVKFTYYCSSSKSASGTFNVNIENSVWEQENKLAFEAQSTAATANFTLKDSVLTTTSHLIFSVAGDYVIDNSNVNVGVYRQLENRGNLTIKNGSVVYASNQVSSNANMPGTLTVDNATYVATGEYSGVNLGIGTLIIQNNASVTLGAISNTNVYKDSTSTLTVNSEKHDARYLDAVYYNVNTYVFSLTADKTALKATESLILTVSIDKAYYSAEYTLTYDATKFSCAADTNSDGVIFVSNLYQGEAGDLATYTLVAKNDIQSVYEDDVFAVSGNVIQYKEQLLNGVENFVIGDTETIKISLNYTVGIKADYVQGYSLVLVKGDDAGYAYNGVKMFYVEAYGAYASLVEGEVTAEMIDAALSKTTNCETIRQSYNVNAEYVNDGIIDIKDATAAYACSILDFDVADYMELYLRADVNGDCKVNMVDINAVVRNYTK